MVWDEAVFKEDFRILSNSQRHFPFHFLWHEAWTTFFNEKGLDATSIILITGPDYSITYSGVADPPLMAI
jgi:hypothetical protein